MYQRQTKLERKGKERKGKEQVLFQMFYVGNRRPSFLSLPKRARARFWHRSGSS